jgi:hypothetical protein
MINKRLPPFAHPLYAQLQAGDNPRNDIFLFIEQCPWLYASGWFAKQSVLAFSPPYSPYHYHWPVQGCSLLVFDKQGVEPFFIEQLAHALLIAGAKIVRVVLFDYCLVIYRSNKDE